MMANYMSSCRSNFFKIGRPIEFMEWIQQFPDLVFDDKAASPDSPQDMYGMLYVDNSDGASWPAWRWDEDDNEIEVDFFHEFSEFLAPGEVAIFQEVGAEKLRYLVGYSVAVNDKGEILTLNMNDIESMVQEEWGVTPTPCTY